MSYRNWNAEGYAAIADYAHDKYSLQTVITGGQTDIERDYANKICDLTRSSPMNLVGKTSLKELLAVLSRATVVIAPDSGPAHMATAVGTPVIGLYAATNPERARPYMNPELIVNRYPDAVYGKFKKPAGDVPWGTRIREPCTMERITIEDVQTMLDHFMARSSA